MNINSQNITTKDNDPWEKRNPLADYIQPVAWKKVTGYSNEGET